MTGDISRFIGRLTQGLHLQRLVQEGRAGFHGGTDVQNGLQNFVLNTDQLQGLFGDMRRRGGHRRDRMPFVKHFVGGQHVCNQVWQANGPLPDVGHLVFVVLREVGARHHGLHARKRFCRARIDGQNTGVRVRAAEGLSDQHAGRVGIRTVLRTARYLIHAIVADRSRSHHIVTLDAKIVFGFCRHRYLISGFCARSRTPDTRSLSLMNRFYSTTPSEHCRETSATRSSERQQRGRWHWPAPPGAAQWAPLRRRAPRRDGRDWALPQ